jgi:hypothetical protein
LGGWVPVEDDVAVEVVYDCAMMISLLPGIEYEGKEKGRCSLDEMHLITDLILSRFRLQLIERKGRFDQTLEQSLLQYCTKNEK